MPVDMLVNNAGFGSYGRFESIPAQRDHQQVLLNVAAVVDLTHAFVPDMLARGGGSVINVASVVSFWPLPYQAVYGATKAFVLSFSEALAVEYRGRGIHVLALCPGSTATRFRAAARAEELPARSGRLGGTRSPEQVVLTAIKALETGKAVAVDGFFNRAAVAAQRLAPPMLVARAAALRTRPKTPIE
jgi:short-subunit dehydrogenase